jgi:apolipoprotein D and lipocalin family protein
LFPPLPVVQGVELERFIGKWYEIAKYPNFFQQQCFGGTTAEYAIREDGNISVVNTCHEGSLDGPESRIEGYATSAAPTTNAKLSVVFFPPFGAPALFQSGAKV